MNNYKNWPFFFLILVACNKPLTVERFINEVTTDEKYKAHYEDDTYQATATYRPLEYMALIEMNTMLKSGDKKTISQSFEKAKSSFSNTVYFTFEISLKGGENIIKKASGNLEQYAYLQDYLTNSILKDFVLSTDQDIEIKPVIHSYQQNFGNSASAVFLVGLPAAKVKSSFKDNFKLVYNDKAFGLSKLVELNFKLKNLLEKRFDILF